jgi:hypothetical protein
MERRKVDEFHAKLQDRQEGEEYRRLAEQYTHEHVELDRYRKLTQKETKVIYDNALEEKQQVKRMEQMMDEVSCYSCISSCVYSLF